MQWKINYELHQNYDHITIVIEITTDYPSITNKEHFLCTRMSKR